jgi:hypothetical protein
VQGLKKRMPVRSSWMVTGDAPAGAGANVSTAMKTAVANAARVIRHSRQPP